MYQPLGLSTPKLLYEEPLVWKILRVVNIIFSLPVLVSFGEVFQPPRSSPVKVSHPTSAGVSVSFVFQLLDYAVSPAWSALPPSHGYVRPFGKQPQLASKLLRAALLPWACSTAVTCLRPSQQSHVGQTSSATVPGPCPKVKPPLLSCISWSSMDVDDLYVQVQDRSC
jgi:hypothetical protein